ncbi:MAG: rhodanese-like domain-containing protein [Pseudomonadota bacterium]
MAIKSVMDMVKAAKAEIEQVSVEDAQARMDDDDFLLVDIRDIRELNRDGRVPGAFHAPRGMLEFWVSPDSPYHKDFFAQEGKKYVFFCAAAARSSLAVKTLQDMGLENAAEMTGGFKAWKDSGAPVETKD